MEDENVIKRKLLFDGEGLGDERRLNLLQKMIASWIVANNSNEENEIAFNKICLQITAIEHSRKKSELIKRTYQRESLKNQEIIRDLENNIISVKKAIESSKTLLHEMRNSKQRKMNYNLIAKQISLEPSRSETTQHVTELKSGIVELKKKESSLNEQWSLWRKHCSVIANSAYQLNSLMESSENTS